MTTWRAFSPLRNRAAGWAWGGLLLFSSPALAVGPIVWTQQTPADFEKGRPDGVAVASRGGLLLARAMKEISIKELKEDAQPFLWSQVIDSKGNLYVGSGNDGRVFKVAKGGQGSLFFTTGDLAVQALAVDSRDNLFVGTSPDGKIYRVTPDGKPEAWYDPDERYIWSLAVDRSGNLFAATGEKGIIYKVTERGKGTPFYDSPESHIVALAFDRQGNLLAGSSGKGLLYRISPDGKGDVLLDTSQKEVNAVAVDPSGRVYASAIQSEPPPSRRSPLPKPVARGSQVVVTAPTAEPTLAEMEEAAPEEEAGGTAARAESAGKVRSVLYRIDNDGIATPVWRSESETIFSLAIPTEKEIYLGTGDLGKVRRLEDDGSSSLVAKLPATQVTSLVTSVDGTLYAATSNSGGLYAMEKEVSDTGTFLSAPRDATSLARWGEIGWFGSAPSGSKVEVFTRSGNSAVPDNTWSDWSPAYIAPSGNHVVSPSARFIQWKARLSRQGKSASPFLESVSLTYLPSNLPPRVEKIEINPPGIVVLKPTMPLEADAAETAFSVPPSPPEGSEFASPFPIPAGKRIFQRGMRSLSWDASDPNGDPLRFDLYFRSDSEKEWKPLVKGCREEYFSWDSETMPDGRYRIRIVASDAPANPSPESRFGEEISSAFVVDNTPPRVEGSSRKEGAASVVDVKVSDSTSAVRTLEYSLDAGKWTAVMPKDGVADSPQEEFKISLDHLPSGEHTLLLKATDAEGNVGSGKVVLPGA